MATDATAIIAIPEALLETAATRHFEGTLDLAELAAGPDTYTFAAPVSWSVEATNTGDAILMGSWAGAAISKSPASPMVHQFTGWSVSFNLSAFIMCWPAVNLKGERYGA